MKKIILASIISFSAPMSFAAEDLFIPSQTVKNTLGKIQTIPNLNTDPQIRVPFANDKNVLGYRDGMQVNPKALDANEIRISLSNGKQITAQKTNRYASNYTNSIVWIGKNSAAKSGTVDEAMSEVILVLRNGKVTGHVTDAGKHFKIGATQSGQHTLAEFSVTTTIPDHPRFTRQLSTLTTAANTTVTTSLQPTKKANLPLRVNLGNEVAEFDQETYASQNKASLAALPGVPVLRILVNYTPAVASASPDILAEIESFVAQANRAYADSRANVRVTLAYAAPISFTESASIENDLTRYANMSEVLSQRNLYAADIGVLLSNAGTTACGLGFFNTPESAAYVNVNFANDCAGQNYSFTHEIAHIFGANHDLPHDTSPKPFPREYAHGYAIDLPNLPNGYIGVRSIMAYADDDKNKKRARVGYFSSPNLLLNNVLFGNSTTADNVRVLNERASAVAAFRAPPTVFYGARNGFKITKMSTSFDITRTADGITESIPKSGAKTFTFDDVIVNLETAGKSKTIPQTTLDSLNDLYVAFFNRVPDSNGMGYWIDQSKAGASLDQIANSFYDAAVLYPAETGYSSTMTNSEFIIIVYKNVLGRTVTASDAGVQYWAGEIASGRQSRGKVVNSIIASARTYKNDPTWGWVANLLDNKLTISKLFCLSYGLSYKTPQLNIINGKAIANAVTPTDVEAAKRLINMTDTGFNLLN